MFRTSSPPNRCLSQTGQHCGSPSGFDNVSSNVRQLCKGHLAIECHFDLRLCHWHILRRFQGTPKPVGVEKLPMPGFADASSNANRVFFFNAAKSNTWSSSILGCMLCQCVIERVASHLPSAHARNVGEAERQKFPAMK